MKLAIVFKGGSSGSWRYLFLLLSHMKKQDSLLSISIFADLDEINRIKMGTKEIEKITEFSDGIYPYTLIENKSNKHGLAQKIKNIFLKDNIKKHSNNILDDFDAIFCPWPYGMNAPKTKSRLFFIPHDFIFTHFFGFHSGHIYTREWWWNQYQQLKTFIDSGAQPIVSSPYIADEYNRVYPESMKKPKVVYLSSFNEYPILEKSQIQKTLEKHDITYDYILYANNWALHKNMQSVIGAFYLVKQKYPNIKLIITGYGTDNIICQCNSPYYLDHVRGDEKYDVKSLGLLDENDFNAVLQGAKLCVNSSLCEAGSGNSLDAWNVKVPVAMSDIPPFKQQVEFLGTKAEFFDPRNSTDMAQAILKILDNPKKAKENAEKSKQSIDNYSWDIVAKNYLNIFKGDI